MAVTETDSNHLRAVFVHHISSLSEVHQTSSGDDPNRRDPLLSTLRLAAAADPGYTALITATSAGFPNR